MDEASLARSQQRQHQQGHFCQVCPSHVAFLRVWPWPSRASALWFYSAFPLCPHQSQEVASQKTLRWSQTTKICRKIVGKIANQEGKLGALSQWIGKVTTDKSVTKACNETGCPVRS